MVSRVRPGEFEFELFLPRAQRVAVAGTFNQWKVDACPMQRDADGWWRTTLTLEDGDHAFQYVIDGQEWMADFAAGGVERNGFGCWVSLLSVDRRSRRDRTLERELTSVLGLLRDATNRLRASSSSQPLPFPVLTRETDDETNDEPCEEIVTIETLARLVA